MTELGATIATDPLNDILLPAQELAQRIAAKDNPRGTERRLAGAVLILMAERTAYRMLVQEANDRLASGLAYAAELEKEVTAEALQRVRTIRLAESRPDSKRVRMQA